MTFAAAPLTTAVIAALEQANLRVGDGEQPAGSGWVEAAGQSTFRGYVVVHPITGGDVDGSLDDPSGDVWPIYQVSAYGANRAQCEAVADIARAALVDRILAGGPVIIDTLGAAARIDDSQPSIWQAADRFVMFSTT